MKKYVTNSALKTYNKNLSFETMNKKLFYIVKYYV